MTFARIGPWQQPGRKVVVHMPPMVRTDLVREVAERFDGVDGAKDTLHLFPTDGPQQNLRPRLYARDSRAGFPGAGPRRSEWHRA